MNIVIKDNYEGMMIREVLKKELGFSVNYIKKLKFSPDGIKVNGNWVTVRYVLRPGDVLQLKTEDEKEDVSPYIIPVKLDIDIIYEDEYFTAVNKPSDMPSHPSLGHKLDTVANALAYRYIDKPYVFRPVNRLDRDTSGCMLTANTRDSSYKMYRLMTEGKIRKTYLAVTDGVPENDFGIMKSYMRRREESIIEREECDPDAPDAKIAITEYTLLSSNGKQSLMSLSPVTGRTHQIRVQLKGIGCPVFGDSLYGNASELISRHALHSYRTSLPHPYTGECLTLTAPLPDDMKAVMKKLSLSAEDYL